MKNNQVTLTMDFGGAQLTVDTQALFRAWMEKHMFGDPSPADALTRPPLREGERLIATIIIPNGRREHIIRMAMSVQTADALTWQAAMNYAAQEGAELPDRVEWALLYAKRNSDEYADEYYWTREQTADNESCAWFQSFDNGNQLIIHKDYKCRVVLVRRVAF